MIVKNDWLAVQDTTKEQLFIKCREECFKKRRCTDIVDYNKAGEVFPGVGVSACYFLYDKEANYDCHYIQIKGGYIVSDFIADFSLTGEVIKDGTLADIVRRVRLKARVFGDRLPIQNTPFGLDTNGVKDIMAPVSSEKTERTPIKLVWGGGIAEYISEDSIAAKGTAILPYWKVCCGEKLNAWDSVPENIVTSHLILAPNEACTGSYAVLNVFEAQEEAINFYKYMKTRFARELVRAGLPSYKRPGKFYFRFLPLQDFTSNSDIDWSQSISDIDEQLFKKYKLTADEVAYIKRTIKPMA